MKFKDWIRTRIQGFLCMPSIASGHTSLQKDIENLQYLTRFILEEYKHDDKLLARIFKNYKYTEYDKLPYSIKTFLIAKLKIERHYYFGLTDTLFIGSDYIGDIDYALGRIEEKINKLKKNKKKGK